MKDDAMADALMLSEAMAMNGYPVDDPVAERLIGEFLRMEPELLDAADANRVLHALTIAKAVREAASSYLRLKGLRLVKGGKG